MMMHKKACKQFAEDKQTKDMAVMTEPCHVVWWDQDKTIPSETGPQGSIPTW